MIPNPIFTYTALAFVIGIVVGLTLARAMLYKAEKTLTQARSMLHSAIDREQRATDFYQEAVRESERTLGEIRRMAQGPDNA